MSDHDRWLEPHPMKFVSRCPCEPCHLCGGKKPEHRGYNEYKDFFFDCQPGENDLVCGCHDCACGQPIASDSYLDECINCSTGLTIP